MLLEAYYGEAVDQSCLGHITKERPPVAYILHFRHTRRHRCAQAYDRTNFYSRPDTVLGSRPRSGELRTQKSKSHLMRTQSLKVLFKIRRYIAMHATLTGRDFFLANFYTSGPFICIFSKTSPDFFLCWLRLTPGFKGRTFKLCVLIRWDFNFCVRSSQLRGCLRDEAHAAPAPCLSQLIIARSAPSS